MKNITIWGMALCLAASLNQPAAASIAIVSSGTGSVTTVYEGNVYFPQVNFTGPGTITNETLPDLNPLVLNVSYSQSDLDFTGAYGSGFRWAQIVTNPIGSGISWYGFQIALSDNSATFSKAGDFLHTPIGIYEVPGLATISSDPIPKISLTTKVDVTDAQGNLVTLSANQKVINIKFGTPIAPGASFKVHIPIEQIGTGGGSFTLTEIASVPEPATLGLWSILGAAYLAARCWRRKRGNS